MERIKERYTIQMWMLFREYQEGHIICDITLNKACTRVVKNLAGERVPVRFPAQKIEGAKLKLYDNNQEFLEKIKSLPRRRTVFVTYQTTMPLSKNTDDMTVINLLTKDEYKILYKPYHDREKKMKVENLKVMRKNKLML
mgnify:CR=1 FL=1